MMPEFITAQTNVIQSMSIFNSGAVKDSYNSFQTISTNLIELVYQTKFELHSFSFCLYASEVSTHKCHFQSTEVGEFFTVMKEIFQNLGCFCCSSTHKSLKNVDFKTEQHSLRHKLLIETHN